VQKHYPFVAVFPYLRSSVDIAVAESDIITLRRSFGCLATALAYLHEKQVRHKDIKPGNILLSEGRVYLCDFGISRDFSQNENSTTEGDVLKFTQRYCAPEVSGREARNTKSDIWSLGCVFMEILSAIKGYGLEEVTNFFLEHSQGVRGQGLWRAPEAMSAWMVKLKSEKNDSADDVPLDWITPMVRAEPQDRLRASELVTMIHKQSAGLPYPGLFIGPCCSRADSIMPIDVAESPNLHPPVFDAFGIKNNSMSPPKTYNFGRPKRKSSPSSMDNRNNLPSSRDSATSRNRSISPRTQSLDPRDSMDTIPFPLDYVRSVGSKASQALRHTLPIFDSPRSSESFGTPRAEYASSPRGPQSPVPPPASFLVKCGCGRRPNEKHIFNASYTTDIPFEFDADIPTVVTCAKCEIGENRVQIYETPPQDPSSQVISPVPMLCWVTRRLVVSYLSGQPEMRHCSSFWVPLTDIKFVYSGNSVTLSWSDCNQVTERSSGNYGQHYDWIYKPKNPNNELTITFNDTTEAVRFVDVIRLPYEDGTTITRDRRVPSSNSSGIDIFDIGRPGVRNYRAAITEVQDLKISELSNDRAAENAGEPSSPDFMTISSIGSTSNLFIVWPELDLVMQNHEVHNDTHAQYQMVVEMRNVATPTYLSNIIDEPAADNDKVARFHKARPVKATMIVNFPYQAHIASRFPEPPSGMFYLCLHRLY
jgi:serine/threonine protein kinase